MLLISYDISDDKLRTKFSKFLSKFGYRLQYSLFQIENSERLIKIIVSEIQDNFEKKFTQSDSIIMIKLSNSCEIIRYGYAQNDEKSVIIV